MSIVKRLTLSLVVLMFAVGGGTLVASGDDPPWRGVVHGGATDATLQEALWGGTTRGNGFAAVASAPEAPSAALGAAGPEGDEGTNGAPGSPAASTLTGAAEVASSDGTVSGVSYQASVVASPGRMLVSKSPDRSNPVPLGGATVSGVLYVFLETSGTANSVSFWIDDSERGGKPHQIERNAPYDLNGGSVVSAKPLDFGLLAPGPHSVAAEVLYKDGSTAVMTVAFSVASGSTSSVTTSTTSTTSPSTTTSSASTTTTSDSTTELGSSGEEDVFLVSARPDRSGPVLLSASQVNGSVYPFLDPEGSVSSVSFWIDDVGKSGPPFQVERNAPFDVAGGSLTTANPLDTSKLGHGAHSVTAEVLLQDGSRRDVTAEFEVVASTTTSSTTTTSWSTTTTTVPTTTSSTVTATTSSTTTTSSASIAEGVLVRAGESIQAAVDRHPEGTTFIIGAGVHKNQRVAPKHRNGFFGEPGAILDGGGSTEYAFGGSGDNVLIQGLVIQNYASPLSKGVIRSVNSGQDWTVKGNEIKDNQGTAIVAVKGWKVIDNHLHHNQQYGMTAIGPSIVVEDNEIAFNNPDVALNPYSAAGGTKFLKTKGLVVRDNYVHHNGGPGLWTDGDNIDTLYEGNRVEANHHAGIKHELSCRAIIRGNTVTGNGFGNPNWLAGAGIAVLNSRDVTVTGNTVSGNEDGIGGIHASRSTMSGNNCSYELKNLSVTDNSISMSKGHTGIATNLTSDVYSASWNNRFSSNTYQVGSDGEFFQWKGGFYDLAEWLAFGMS